MHEIFISYSSKDQKIADAIVNYLESEKIKCWIAYRDADAGEYYAASIVKAIKNATMIILVFSENSNSSKYVLKEIDSACKYEKTIIPFKIDDSKLAEAMEYYLSATHWLDAIDDPMEAHLRSLVSVVKRYLGLNTIEQSKGLVQTNELSQKSPLKLISGLEVTKKDIKEALELDYIVYNIDESYQFPIEKCLAWHAINPDIYFMLKDTEKDIVVGYVNLAPITQECYDKMITGETWDIEISEDNILSYDFPGIYYLNFTSIVIHPEYRNLGAVVIFINAIVNKILELSSKEIYFKNMIADAITMEGVKFCQLFGMDKIAQTLHDSQIYSISLLPPKFKKSSKSLVKLYELYESFSLDNDFVLSN